MTRIFAWCALGLVTVLSSSVSAFTLQIEQDGTPILPWNSSSITFDVNSQDCVAAGVSVDRLNTVLDASIALWNSVSNSSLQVSRGSSVTTTYAQITSQTTSGNPLVLCDSQLATDLSASIGSAYDTNNIPAVTRVLRVDSSGHIALAVVLVNAESSKSAAIQNLIDHGDLFGVVLAHEMGHALGLGHTQDKTALMYFDASAKTKLSLSFDDWNGITYLYPRQELGSSLPFGCATVSGPGQKPSPWGLGVVLGVCWMGWWVMRQRVRKFRLFS